MLTICPYTKLPLELLERSSREHIIPDALGCPDAFSVTADAQLNSEFGDGIDGYLANSFMARSIASRLGIKTRTGPAKLTLKGHHKETGVQVQLNISKDGFDANIPGGVVKDPDTGEIAGLVGFNDAAARSLEQINATRQKRGKPLLIPAETRRVDSTVRGRIELDLSMLSRALLKVAYLTAAYSIGDSFLTSPSGTEMLVRISSPDNADLESFSYLDLSGEQLRELHLLPGSLEERHHYVGWIRSDKGLLLVVRLFDCDLLSACYFVKDFPPHQLPSSGAFYLIDTLGSGVTRLDLRDLFQLL